MSNKSCDKSSEIYSHAASKSKSEKATKETWDDENLLCACGFTFIALFVLFRLFGEQRNKIGGVFVVIL